VSEGLLQKIGPIVRLLKRILTNFVDVSNEASMDILCVILQKTQIVAVLADVMRTIQNTET
jgi:hypothetical protein